ncbi:peptidylprolyl isomerase [Pigmentiphaga soli]|uniref:Peptidyl-prolyl cis-trans isomerase n=1 Tax=Pigmentiphaga soli TaxID=1007095 RepID=A0ABP8H5R3_9BURK
MKRFLFAAALSAATLGAAHAGPQVALSTSQGRIVLDLDDKAAPQTVANFLQYVRDGQYNGTIFHRVIDGFMIQGGGFTPDMREKPTRAPIRNEAANGLKNTRYTIAMARTSDPNSATAQFFINVSDNAFLDYRNPTVAGIGYAVFGKVTQGTDVVDRIKAAPTADRGPFQNVPVQPIVIEKAEVIQP